jgi:transposase
LFFIVAMPRQPTRALSERTRWEIVFLKKTKGLSNRAIARALKCSEHGVRCVLKKEAATGQVADLPRSGRPRLLSKKRLAQFDSLIRKNRSATAAQLAVLARKPLRLKISARTAQRERKRLGYQWRRRTKTMALNKFAAVPLTPLIPPLVSGTSSHHLALRVLVRQVRAAKREASSS